MSHDRYVAFLPAEHRTMIEPVPTWWDWRGRRVHVARAVRPDSAVRLLVLHGGGGHAGALWPLAALAARDGVEVLVPDMPLYGRTVEPHPGRVRYGDWVDLVCDLVRHERADDPRPLVVLGASMGGMLGYEVAARTGELAHVVVTCLLDPSDPAARRAAARTPVLGAVGAPVLRALDPLCGRLRMPVRLMVNMMAMSGDPALARLCAGDPLGGGVRAPLGFLASWLNFAHTRPEDFDAAPVTLVHPAADAWTPPELSTRFLARLRVPTRTVMLENCGHYPVEQPGVDQLVATLRAVRDEVTGQSAVNRSTRSSS
ncbi:alpha/beta fold hydrolase [Mycobacterium sp. PS03-16]|uniref:alpha/beta hydrolase n=1 Tax=Mycobacterium sp. PS03-16 TaxID=2559611 RepID=UPI001073E794|nr:alpha/beta fold hydrolase [Mycobacterium sp. PS03-16]TFV55044.1 alpha/beta fold hydrolase [Mycobacterium sp. PS03-16]